MLGEHVAGHAEMPFRTTSARRSSRRSGLALDPSGHPGAGMHGSLEDVLALGRELLSPRLVAAETHEEMVSVQFPGLDGVLPDFGRFRPLDWGLGVELEGDEGGALVGHPDVAEDVRPLRRQRDVPLGRPRPPHRVRGADDPALRRLGEGGVAAALRRGPP